MKKKPDPDLVSFTVEGISNNRMLSYLFGDGGGFIDTKMGREEDGKTFLRLGDSAVYLGNGKYRLTRSWRRGFWDPWLYEAR